MLQCPTEAPGGDLEMRCAERAALAGWRNTTAATNGPHELRLRGGAASPFGAVAPPAAALPPAGLMFLRRCHELPCLPVSQS